MTTMYSPLVYPFTPEGEGYSEPTLPSTFVSLYATTPTWNPYSANAADRTQYWVDTAGTLTLETVEVLLYGLSGIQAQQIALVEAGYQAALLAGFTSSALGSAYTYPSQIQDQLNVLGAATLSLLPAGQVGGWTTQTWCTNSSGVSAMVAHTATQIQQVLADSETTKQANINQNTALAASIMAVTTSTDSAIDTIQAIVWVAPS